MVSQQWRAPAAGGATSQWSVVLFEILRDGRIKDPIVEQTSGDSLFDQSAIRAIVEASPFPPLPQDYKGASLRVHLGFPREKTPPIETGARPVRPSDVYQTAYMDFTRGEFSLAIAGFEEFLKRFPDSDLADKAQYRIGEANFGIARDLAAKGQPATQAYERAAQEFRKVVINYPKGDIVVTAIYKEALTLLELKQQALAAARFQYLVDQFPQTEEAALARDRLAALRGRR